jgi:hypothetical protein
MGHHLLSGLGESQDRQFVLKAIEPAFAQCSDLIRFARFHAR